MDANQLNTLHNIVKELIMPNYYDKWMLGIAAVNAVAFISTTILLICSNRRIAKNQEDLQKRNLRLQLFEKRYPICDATTKSKSQIKIDVLNLDIVIEKKITTGYLKNILEIIKNEIKLNYAQSKYLFKNGFVEKLDRINTDIQVIYIQYEKVEREYLKFKQNILNDINKVISDLATWKISYHNQDIQIKKDQLQEIGKQHPLVRELINYSDLVDEYCKYIKEYNVLEEFHEYLNIHDLEK